MDSKPFYYGKINQKMTEKELKLLEILKLLGFEFIRDGIFFNGEKVIFLRKDEKKTTA